MVKDCSARAVRPFVREAKLIFRAEAGPMRGEMWVMFRMVEREGVVSSSSGEEGRG